MKRLLVIDDDAALLDALALTFEDAGYHVTTAANGREGRALIDKGGVDAVVCDVIMPQLDGLSLCREIRAAGNDVPFLLLTSRADEIDEAFGLSGGADDYVAKPFSSRVLVARVGALLRRGARQPEVEVVVRGPLRVDRARMEIRLNGTVVAMTVTEHRLVAALAERAGMVLSREQLLRHVRDEGSVVEPRLIDTYVRRVRRKLEAVDSSFSSLETVIGAGYRLRAP